MANAALNYTALDPDTLKASLIAFAQTKPQYAGYNFQGQNFNAILDVLSRNSALRSFYSSMGFAETFLSSAQLRDNVVSRTKEFGYIPSSMTSSTTIIDMTINTNGLQSFTIPAGTRFNSVNSNGSFNFVTSDVLFNTSSTGNYSFSNVSIYEGNPTLDLFVVDSTVNNQLFTLTNQTIDINSINVSVTENNGANTVVYQPASDIFGLSGNSLIYYVQPTSNNQYQIQFGDGVLGYQPQNGSIVSVNYRINSGTDGDGCAAFILLDNIGAFNGGTITNINISPLNPSSSGANAESVDSIKFNAPRAWQALGRGVVPGDYKALITKQFPSIGDVNIYGGRITANAVLFGTVLISAVTVSGNPLTLSQKSQVLNYIDDQDVIHASTVMIDANTLFIDVSSNVNVDFTLTSLTANQYQVQIANIISNFSSNTLQKFGKVFRYSKLTDAIDNYDKTAIDSNETTIQIKRQIPLTVQTNTSFSFSFNNPVANVFSDAYVANGFSAYITDVINNYSIGNGTMYQVFLNSSNNIVNYNIIGSVNYTTGSVNISNLNISEFSTTNSAFYIHANPNGKDIYPQENDIIKIDTVKGVKVNVLAV